MQKVFLLLALSIVHSESDGILAVVEPGPVETSEESAFDLQDLDEFLREEEGFPQPLTLSNVKKRSVKESLSRRSALDKNFMRFGRSGDTEGGRKLKELVRLTRSGAPDAPKVDTRAAENFLRFGKAKDNFMRFGRGNDNFMRFGKAAGDNFMRFGKAAGDNFMRFGRAKDNFMRFGRGGNDNFMRFGRGKNDNFMRFGRGKNDNFMRFGRGGNDNFMRFGRGKNDNFMRFGKGGNDNFMRFGKGGNENFIRFGKRAKDNFIRFGRPDNGNNFMRFGKRAKDNFIRFGRPDNGNNFMRFGRGSDDIGEDIDEEDYEMFGRDNRTGLLRMGRDMEGDDVEEEEGAGDLDLSGDKPKEVARVKREATWQRDTRDKELMEELPTLRQRSFNLLLPKYAPLPPSGFPDLVLSPELALLPRMENKKDKPDSNFMRFG